MADDRITIGVTHEATINGDQAWIKFEYSTDVPGGEADVDKANQFVQKKIIDIIESTAHTAMAYQGK